MKTIIITVTDRRHSFRYDMELPVDQPGGKLGEDVMEVLNHTHPEMAFNGLYHCLYLERQGCRLSDRQSLAEAGVLNGDIVTIVSRI